MRGTMTGVMGCLVAILGAGAFAACNDEVGVVDVTDTGAATDTVVATDTGTVTDTAVATETNVATETSVATDTVVATETTETDTTVTDTTATETTETDTIATDTTVTDTDTTDTDTVDPALLACDKNEDCRYCSVPFEPHSIDDCKCQSVCPNIPMNTKECTAATEAWNTICGGAWAEQHSCPVAMCLGAKPLFCDNGQCAAACDQAQCPSLACPEEEQMVLPGQCCPSCVGDTRCFGDADCQNCLYPTAPTSAADCYCTGCPISDPPLPASVCLGNEKAWHQFCDAWTPADGKDCPAMRCSHPTAPTCDRYGQCVPNPNACAITDQCERCDIGGPPPENPSECHCPTCGVPMATNECVAIHEAMDIVCADFDYTKCPVPGCAFPPPIACLPDSMTCGYDFSGSP